MRIVVALKQVPDLVEELELASDESDVDREFLSFVLSEWDDHALEEALLLREAAGAEVVCVALDEPEIDRSLYTALAKGADRAVKLTGAGEGWIDAHARAAVLAAWLRDESFDLVLSGVQAVDDLDGQLPPILGTLLSLPHASVVIDVEAKAGSVVARQDLGAGVVSELELGLPAVLGIQAASQPPRYASITRIRQATQAGGIEEVAVGAAAGGPSLAVRRLFEPERAERAEMLNGDAARVAERIVELLRGRGLVKS